MSAMLSHSMRDVIRDDDRGGSADQVGALRQSLIDEVLSHLLQGHVFLALTGPPGSGKSVVASRVHYALLQQSMRGMKVRRGESQELGLKAVAAPASEQVRSSL